MLTADLLAQRAQAPRGASVSWPAASRQRPVARRPLGRFMRASLPSPRTSWAGHAQRAGERSASSITPSTVGLVDARPSARARGPERLPPAAQRVVVVRARVDDPWSRWWSGRCGPAGGRSKPNCRTACPGSPASVAQALDRRRDDAEVLRDQRQLASSSRRVEDTRPGAPPWPRRGRRPRRRARPSRRRTRGSGRSAPTSTSSKVRRKRSTHQR